MGLPRTDEVLAEASRRLETLGRVALCQIVKAEGSTPGKVGWKLLVSPRGDAYGNLGGGAFEALVTADARRQLSDDGPAQTKRYYLTEEATRGEPTGMVCGGFADVLIEVLRQRPLLVICGGGPVGQALARNAVLCDFEVRVVEDRSEFRRPELFPEGVEFAEVSRDFEEPFLEDEGRALLVAVVTRCWETDLAAAAAVLRRRPERLEYLGLMGSSRKVERVRAELGELGLDPSRLHAPIGLPLGGDTPAEIAVAILAEIIQSRRGAAEQRAPRPVADAG